MALHPVKKSGNFDQLGAGRDEADIDHRPGSRVVGRIQTGCVWGHGGWHGGSGTANVVKEIIWVKAKEAQANDRPAAVSRLMATVV